MKMTEQVSYLQGLMAGLAIDESTNEGKVLTQMVKILDDMAHAMEDLQEEVEEVTELVDLLDSDLCEVEEALTEEDFEDDEEECGCGCHGRHEHDLQDEDDIDFDEDEEYYEVTCPTCGDVICLNEAMLEEGSISCPGCGENLEFDFDLDESSDVSDVEEHE